MAHNTGPELLLELEDFMDEVDIINNTADLSASPPESDWLVHFDASTKQTTYRHIYSGDERADMPVEYATYLERFNRYMTRCLNGNGTDPATNEGDTVRKPAENAGDSLQTVESRKRKRKRSDSKARTGNVELSELICYSASSDSDINSEDTEAGEPKKAFTDTSLHMEEITSLDFIGPKLPDDVNKAILKLNIDFNKPSHSAVLVPEANAPQISDHSLGLDVDIQRSPISPSHSSLSSCPAIKEKLEIQESGASKYDLSYLPEDASEEKSGETKESKRSRRGKRKYKEREPTPTSRLEDTVEILKDKFATFDVVRSEISPLHRLYIQMTTRLEDWRRGKLSSRYFSKRLAELEDRLLAMASDSLPNSCWTCHWDVDSRRYYYYNKTTKTSQWSIPGQKQSGSLSPSTITSSATIVRPPQLVPAEETDQTDTKPDIRRIAGNGHQSSLSVPLAQIHTESADSAPIAELPNALIDAALPTENTALVRDKEELLNEQLKEFAIACLEFSSPTGQDGPIEDRLLVDCEGHSPPASTQDQTSRQQPSEIASSNSKTHCKKRKTASATKGLSGGGKDLPHLIQKWQNLQESL